MKFLLLVSVLLFPAGLVRSEEKSTSLKVLCWNIHHGRGADDKVDLERIAAVIRGREPDVMMLQEVDKNCERSGKVDQPAELARLTGMKQVFGKAMDFQGGEYGQALLSRFPLAGLKIHRLPGDGEPRVAISAMVETPLGPVMIAGLHLDHKNPATRDKQAEVVSVGLLKETTGPIILAGDFNATPDSGTLAVFRQPPWSVVAKEEPSATCPADNPKVEIDFTVLRGLRQEKPSIVLPESIASDHRPVLTIVAKPE
ncbi:endonuclease/exonuclease/phosphatase family protein [Luteolibacter yonseiensis]|uniref:Endonuclease/exonuclease/phosphatase family protein n=1 Tax=Luteolibacter yonseiensis TaxID=1144680 RepID=A0A934R0S7_9BACT|nr:endonuclease/exonuclease/phosphatase family protein [Luteolibacter yonseiensis]MBK1814781.1 endonuclease/exonuclease/phosphatase family protein [Luteolibacter yonseiensis]